MKKTILSIMLVVSSILVILLCSCGTQTIEFADKDFYVVYGEEAKDTILKAVSNTKSFVEETLDTTCKRVDDTSVESGIKIVVGDTSYKESNEAKKGLLYYDYTITARNGMIIIIGGSNEATVDATNYFCQNYKEVLESGKFESKDDYTYHAEYKVKKATIAGADLTKYTIVYPDSMGMYSEKATVEKYVASRLQRYFIDVCGVQIDAHSDANEKSDYEILIGKTNRSESESFFANNTPDKYGYILKQDGKSLNFAAGGLWGYTKAIESFGNYIDGDKLSTPSSLDTSDDTGITPRKADFVYITDKGVEKTPVGQFTIAGNDISNYKIVYDKRSDDYTGFGEGEIRAALDLQRYIEYATGVKLEAVDDDTAEDKYEIVVGRTNRTTPNMDKIETGEDVMIEVAGSKLYLSGGEERGALYSVYTFLEDYLGVRFFASDCEIIYFADSLDVPDGTFVHEVSDMEYRENDAFDALGEDIAVKLKINGSFQREMDFCYGGSVAFVGGSNGFVHTFNSIFGLAKEDSQPCLTDEDNIQQCIKITKGYLNLYKDTEIFCISQNDNYNFCQCKNCAKIDSEEGSHAGALIYFINRVADAIKDDYPDTKILTLAYMFSQDAPKTPPRDNVIIELCNYDVCVGHAIGTCDENKDFGKQLSDWSKLTDNLYIWYYASNFVMKTLDTPIMNMNVLYDNFQIMRNYGVNGFFAEATLEMNSGDFGQLRTYLLSKLCWYPDMSREQYNAYIDEFLYAFYGDAGDVVHKYYDYLYSISGKNHYSLYTTPNSMFDEFEFRVTCDEIAVWLDVAKNMTSNDKAANRHVKQVITGFEFIREILE